MSENKVSADRLRDVLDFDQRTGVFTWKKVTSNRVAVGSVAGSLHEPTGYRFVSVDGRMYKAHRLAWLYVNGEWPAGQIDHINGKRDDNRISNLRVVTAAQNLQNQRAGRGRTSSLLGVSWDSSRGRWRAVITVDGKYKQLGRFKDESHAYECYLNAKRAMHTACTI